MQSAILNFPNQLKWQPIIEGGQISPVEHYLLCGMGGSALAGGLLTACDPTIPLTIHRDYGLPTVMAGSPLLIISSFSGQTEETLDAYQTAREAKLPLMVITSGGELLARAQRDGVPQIILPDPTIAPRLAVGYFLRALALITGAKQIGDELESLASTLDLAKIEAEGRAIASRLSGRIPLIYSSNRYAPVAYFWKIMMNETAKIPAFFNIIPEQNHNELESFDGASLAPFTIVTLTSADDHPRVTKRFRALAETLPSLNVPVENFPLPELSATACVINSILLASFTALALAEARGVDPAAVPAIEDFKHYVATV